MFVSAAVEGLLARSFRNSSYTASVNASRDRGTWRRNANCSMYQTWLGSSAALENGSDGARQESASTDRDPIQSICRARKGGTSAGSARIAARLTTRWPATPHARVCASMSARTQSTIGRTFFIAFYNSIARGRPVVSTFIIATLERRDRVQRESGSAEHGYRRSGQQELPALSSR